MFLVILFLSLMTNYVQSQTELILPPLPYEYDALEPVLSEKLMRLHHDKHHQAYTTKANIALKSMFNEESDEQMKELAQQPIEILLTQLSRIPQKYQLTVRNNGGGYVNHKLFFSMLRKPTGPGEENIPPSGLLLQAIETSFGSFDKFKEIFTTTSINLFGSGWVWLYINPQTKRLTIDSTVNQDNPIMFDKDRIVILGIDVWEHAYYPVYENRRNEYVDQFWRIVNWSFVETLYNQGISYHSDL